MGHAPRVSATPKAQLVQSKTVGPLHAVHAIAQGMHIPTEFSKYCVELQDEAGVVTVASTHNLLESCSIVPSKVAPRYMVLLTPLTVKVEEEEDLKQPEQVHGSVKGPWSLIVQLPESIEQLLQHMRAWQV
mmetsp:Transcript_21840/g.35113  ORF Transcript_21840/g.35113 Transcript_21840/m.35113 type:complete len:131 (+) Transcript_21840:168-560(+)